MTNTMTYEAAVEQATKNGHDIGGEPVMYSLGRGFAYFCRTCGEHVYVARKTGAIGGDAHRRACNRN